MKFILFNISIFLLVSCSNEIIENSELVERQGKAYKINSEKPFTGDAFSYHKNGQVSLTTSYKNGLKEGIKDEFFDNGQLLSSVNYFMDLKEGEEKIYYKSGELNYLNVYKNGNLIDKKRLSKEGYDLFFILLDSGCDPLEENDESDVVEMDVEIGNSKDESSFDFYFLHKTDNEPVNGKVVVFCGDRVDYQGLVEDGQEIGNWEFFDTDSTVRVEPYVGGLIHGVVKSFDADGKIYNEVCFMNNFEVEMSLCISE